MVLCLKSRENIRLMNSASRGVIMAPFLPLSYLAHLARLWVKCLHWSLSLLLYTHLIDIQRIKPWLSSEKADKSGLGRPFLNSDYNFSCAGLGHWDLFIFSLPKIKSDYPVSHRHKITHSVKMLLFFAFL